MLSLETAMRQAMSSQVAPKTRANEAGTLETMGFKR